MAEVITPGPKERANTEIASHGDPRLELIERVIGTPSMMKSARLKEFLWHVVRMKVSGRADEISEHSIGISVFQRPEHYDPSVDSIVRAHAVRLRAKLDEYFAGEGASELLRVSIPKGGYVPVFSESAQPEIQGAIPFETAKPVNASLTGSAAGEPNFEAIEGGRTWRRAAFGLAVVALVLAMLLALTTSRLHRDRAAVAASTPAMPQLGREMWSALFSRDRSTIVVPGDNGLVLYEDMTGKTVSLHQYLEKDHSETVRDLFAQREGAVADNLGERRITTIVDLTVVDTLQRLATSLHAPLQVGYARDIHLDELKNSNVILIGATEANPWVDLFEPSMDFSFHDNVSERIFTVFNRAPRKSEAVRYESRAEDPQKKVFGLVAFLPNLNNSGNVLILEGTSQAGTEAAADFLFYDPRFEAFLRRNTPTGKRLRYFELLLATSKYGGSSAQSQIVAYHLH